MKGLLIRKTNVVAAFFLWAGFGLLAAPETAPDWQARYKEARAKYRAAFKAPEPGQTVKIQLKQNSKVVVGALVELSEKQVVLNLDIGRVNYPRKILSDTSRAILWPDDYAHYRAYKTVKAEKRSHDLALRRAEYEERKRRQAAAEAEAARRREAEQKDRAMAEASRPQAPMVNRKDGSVVQVMDYLKENTRNADSIRYVRWGKIRKEKDGYRVSCVYKVAHESLGEVTESKYFFMDPFGHVTRTAPYRGAGF
ncbi:MAG: hypothetical protein AAF492_10030 [Verrucomicrobiota bacterium]